MPNVAKMLPWPIIHKILLAYCAQPTWIMIKKCTHNVITEEEKLTLKTSSRLISMDPENTNLNELQAADHRLYVSSSTIIYTIIYEFNIMNKLTSQVSTMHMTCGFNSHAIKGANS